MVGTGLTANEEAFLRRALPHFMSGKSVAESMKAVLGDDARLVNAALDSSHGYLGFNASAEYHVDHLAKSVTSHLSQRVYNDLRSAQARAA